MGRGWQEDENGTTSTPPLELPARHSFGFGLTIHEADENTSSDAEPGIQTSSSSVRAALIHIYQQKHLHLLTAL